MTAFDLSQVSGIKKRKKRGPFNRRFTPEEAARIRACAEANERRHGVLAAIARETGATTSDIWWIVDGRAYK